MSSSGDALGALKQVEGPGRQLSGTGKQPSRNLFSRRCRFQAPTRPPMVYSVRPRASGRGSRMISTHGVASMVGKISQVVPDEKTARTRIRRIGPSASAGSSIRTGGDRSATRGPLRWTRPRRMR